MKKLLALAVLVSSLVLLISVSNASDISDEEFIVECWEDGSKLYTYSFRKPLPHAEFCGPIDEPSRYHPMASEMIRIPGVEKVVSIKKYSVTIITGRSFSKDEIEAKLLPIIGKKLKVKNVVLINKAASGNF